jgi:SAM-dependent methyltransferase
MGTRCPVCNGEVKYLFTKNTYRIFKCRYCKLGFIHPLPTVKEIEAFYNTGNYYYQSQNKGYADYSGLEGVSKKTYRNFFRYMNKKYQFNIRRKNILEVGCAYGFFLDVAQELGASELWGTDITRESERMTSLKGYKFLRGAFELLEFPEDYFDLVFMGDVFEHFLDPFKAVKILSTILKPNGIVVLTTLNFDSLFAKVAGKHWRLLIPPEHIYYWTKKSINILFNKNKFEGICKGYTIYLTKDYLMERFKLQFAFNPIFFKVLPFKFIPMKSFDTIKCIFQKKK